MKRPLQALLISPDRKMRHDILKGTKTITIREGHRDYQPGPVMLCCHLEPWAVMADITQVKHCTLAEVSETEYKADGFSSFEDLLEGMHTYYPNLMADSPVTVIEWGNTRGALVQEYQKMLVFKEAYRKQNPIKPT